MLDSTVLLWAVSAACLLWAGLGAWIVGGRLHYDRLGDRTVRDAGLLASGKVSARRCSWRSLVAGCSDLGAAAIAAPRVVRRNPARLMGAASGRRFSRTHALRVLVRGGFPHAFEEFRALGTAGDRDVIEATVAIAGETATSEADAFLLDVLVAGDHPRSRTADQLVPRVGRFQPTMLELATHADPAVRYWALMLLARAAGRPRFSPLRWRQRGDSDGQVRGAAARVLGSYRSDRRPARPAAVARRRGVLRPLPRGARGRRESGPSALAHGGAASLRHATGGCVRLRRRA